jgi:hypothetical protein
VTRREPKFASPLADGITQFVEHKRVLGRRYETEAGALHLFDRYLIEQGIASPEAVTPAVIQAFLVARPRSRPRSYNHLRGVLHRLFRWLIARGHVAKSPVLCTNRRASSVRTPFILAPPSARRLLELAAALLEQPEEAEGQRDRSGAVEPAAQDAARGDVAGSVAEYAEKALQEDRAPLGRRPRLRWTQLEAAATAVALQLDGAA